jgi:hypothetical protein
MDKKIFSEKIIVATSQYITTDYTRRMIESIKQDNIDFTSLVVYDGTPLDKILDLNDIVDLSVSIKKGVHSLPELNNIIVNIAKSTDAEYLLYSDNDFEYKQGSFASMCSLLRKYDVISPVKIDHDKNKFNSYFSNEDPTEVIGWNDCAWFIKLDKLSYNPFDRKYGPLGFEDAPLQFRLWKEGVSFVVDNRAVAFHHCSQDTPYCFTPEDREKYSKEWDLKAKYFIESNGPSAQWFFDNVIKNSEAIKEFGYPVFVK